MTLSLFECVLQYQKADHQQGLLLSLEDPQGQYQEHLGRRSLNESACLKHLCFLQLLSQFQPRQNLRKSSIGRQPNQLCLRKTGNKIEPFVATKTVRLHKIRYTPSLNKILGLTTE